MKDPSLRLRSLLATVLCALCVAPVSAQQAGRVSAPQVAAPPQTGAGAADRTAERHGIIVVGGTPAERAATPMPVTGPGSLNPQPLPPRPPYPPSAPGSASPPDDAVRAGIIVVGGKSGQPAVDQAQPGAVSASRSKQRPTTSRQRGQ